MTFNRPQKPTRPTSASQRPPSGGSGQGNNRQPRSGGDGGNGELPSPWLGGNHKPDATASFVEYLRWMRSPDSEYKDATKVQILHMATDKSDDRQRLKVLNQRTKAIAGDKNWFVAKTSWRIRVGGHRGPENILLPAFDALGMPYLPASTLRGVARNQGIRHFMTEEGLNWSQAEKKIWPYFGSLEAADEDRSGKVIFLDAYPNGQSTASGLTMDMANNIWNWVGDRPEYNPNPNPFLSLFQVEFVIGLRSTNQGSPAVLQQVRQWLIAGLQQGAGSQVNTGYGTLLVQGKSQGGFLAVDFQVEGQLIHGQQRFTQWTFNDRQQRYQMRGQPVAESRPVAFKSMLRYWFRTLALGVLSADHVKDWEAQIFGAINPQKQGWLKVDVLDGKIQQKEARPNQDGKKDPCGVQVGKLVLQFSAEIPLASQPSSEKLLTHLTWLMFHLGGIGQGARRPCYSRSTRPRAPWWRGSNLIANSAEDFWALPEAIDDVQKLFQQRLQGFYQALAALSGTPTKGRLAGTVANDQWVEALDNSGVLLLCTGSEKYNKPYALSVLHSDEFKVKKRDQLDYDPNLCGSTTSKPVKPSPVWIADFGDFQVVTIFGISNNPQNPRQKFLQALQKPKDGVYMIHQVK